MSNTTTGKWTAKNVISMLRGSQPYTDIADAHNAALAAERERYQFKANLTDEVVSLKKQLAAFRQLVDAATIVVNTDSSSRQWIQVKEALRAALAKIGGK